MIQVRLEQDFKKLRDTKKHIPKSRTNYVNGKLEEIRKELHWRTATLYPPSSIPGDYPHQRSGRYRKGFRVRPAEEVGGLSRGYVYNMVKYASFLEYGTYKMKARPAIALAMETIRKRSQFKNQAVEFFEDLK